MYKLIFFGAGSRISAAIIQAVILVLVTRILGASAFGHFAAVVSATAMASVVFGMGMDSLSLRLSGLPEPRRVGASIVALRYPIVFLSAGVGLLTGWLLGTKDLMVVLSGIGFAVYDSAGLSIEAVIFGLNRPKRAQVLLVLRRIVMCAGVLIGWKFGVVLPVVACLSVLSLPLLSLSLCGLVGRPHGLVGTIRYALPYLGATLLAKVQTLDTVFASSILPAEAAGVYAGASRVTSPLNTVAAATLSILTPRLADTSNSSERSSAFVAGRRLLRLSCILLVVASPAVGIVTEYVLGSSFSGVAVPAAIMSSATGFAAINQAYVSYYFAQGRPNVVAVRRLIGVCIAACCAVPLAWVWGATGMAGTMLLLQVVLLLLLGLHFRRTEGPSQSRLAALPLEA